MTSNPLFNTLMQELHTIKLKLDSVQREMESLYQKLDQVEFMVDNNHDFYIKVLIALFSLACVGFCFTFYQMFSWVIWYFT